MRYNKIMSENICKNLAEDMKALSDKIAELNMEITKGRINYSREHLKDLKQDLSYMIQAIAIKIMYDFGVIHAIGPKKEHIRLVFDDQLKASKSLYKKYNVPATSLENFQKKAHELLKIREIMQITGFDSFIIIPKGLNAQKILKNSRFMHFHGSPIDSQNSKSKYFFTGESKYEIDQNVINNSVKQNIGMDSIILYNSKDLTADHIDHFVYPSFECANLDYISQPLYVLPYLILDRIKFDKTGQHLFNFTQENARELYHQRDRNPMIVTGWLPNERMIKIKLVANL